MELLTLNITVGEDEFAGNASELVGRPDGFIHETRKLYIEPLGAVTINDEIGVSDVRLVVGRAGILAVPARREHDLEADAISAVGIEIRLLGKIMAVESTLRGLGVVEAVKANSALLEIVLGSLTEGSPEGLLGVGAEETQATDRVVAAGSVSGNHAEVVGEGLDALVGIGGIRVQEVVAGEESTNSA